MRLVPAAKTPPHAPSSAQCTPPTGYHGLPSSAQCTGFLPRASIDGRERTKECVFQVTAPKGRIDGIRYKNRPRAENGGCEVGELVCWYIR